MSSIPTTGRTPEFLAKQFGYISVEDMANSLKPNCLVFDIGAGKSQLGKIITTHRKDIKWLNIDPCYKNSKYINSHEQSNQNLEFLSIDITNKDDYDSSSFQQADYIFSYWLLPHLSSKTDEPAIKMIKSIHGLLATEGKMIIGPIKKIGFGFLSPWRYKSSVIFSKSDDLDTIIIELVKATKLWFLPRIIQDISNKHNIHIARYFVAYKK
mgnify:CR=1 FL=1